MHNPLTVGKNDKKCSINTADCALCNLLLLLLLLFFFFVNYEYFGD